MWPVLLSLTVSPGQPLPSGLACHSVDVGKLEAPVVPGLLAEAGARGGQLCSGPAVLGGLRGLLQVESCDGVSVARASWMATWSAGALPGLPSIDESQPATAAASSREALVSLAKRDGWVVEGIELVKGPARWAVLQLDDGGVSAVVLSAGKDCGS